jgi:putative transposase
MLKLLLRACISDLRSRRQPALENLALQHQIEILQRSAGRPRLRTADRAFWVLLSRICDEWRRHLVVFQPDTVIRWHRLGWRLYWRRKNRPQRTGRPIAEPEPRSDCQTTTYRGPDPR